MEQILNYNFFLHEECLKFAKQRVKKKKFSKNGELVFVKNNYDYFLIDGYHRLMEHYIFDVDISLLNIKIKKEDINITFKDFIHYEKFRY